MKGEEDHRTSGKQGATRSTATATYRIGLSYPDVEPWTIAVVVGSTRTSPTKGHPRRHQIARGDAIDAISRFSGLQA